MKPGRGTSFHPRCRGRSGSERPSVQSAPKRAGTFAAWINGVAPELAAKNKEYMFQVAMGKTIFLVNENWV